MTKGRRRRPRTRWTPTVLLCGGLSLPSCLSDTRSPPPAPTSAPPASSSAPGRCKLTKETQRSYQLFLSGQAVGTAKVLHRPAHGGGREIERESRWSWNRKLDGQIDRFDLHLIERETLDGALGLRQGSETFAENGQFTQNRYRRTEDGLLVEVRDPAGTRSQRLDWPPGAMTPSAAMCQLIRESRRGPLHFSSFDPSAEALVPSTLELLDHRSVPSPTGRISAYEFMLSQGETRQRVIVDEQLVLVRSEADGVVMAWSEASSPVSSPTLSSHLPVRGTAPFHIVEFRIRDEDPELPPIFETNAYQRVWRTGKSYRLELKDTAAPQPPLSLAPQDRRRLLEATPLSQSDHPAVRSAVREVLAKLDADRTDPLRQSQAISRWIYNTLDKDAGTRAGASAVETLARGHGDCSEHTALAVAMLRAAKLPARSAAGIVLRDDGERGKVEATYHAWAEVWLGGWVALDATRGIVGTPARYLRFTDERALLRTWGRSEITLLPAVREVSAAQERATPR